ncbi:MAG: hypothetical protein SFV32_07060, partial [Opitutaceae bacterium]|nr:hypothetical protein [Opitutaceae bacterium]
NEPVRAAASRMEGPPERAITLREKGTFRRGGHARDCETTRYRERASRRIAGDVSMSALRAMWVNETAFGFP